MWSPFFHAGGREPVRSGRNTLESRGEMFRNELKFAAHPLGDDVDVAARFLELSSDLRVHERRQPNMRRSAGASVYPISDSRALGGGAVLGELEGFMERADGELGVLVLDDARHRDLGGRDHLDVDALLG